MKKKLSSILLIVTISALVIFVVIMKLSSSPKENGSVYENEIKVLNQSYPSDIIVFGEDVGFDPSLQYRTISELKEENLISESKYVYTFLVINDHAGKLNITDEQFKLCKKMLDEKKVNFYYIGKQYLSKLKDYGFYDALYGDDYCGIGTVISPFGTAPIQGLWREEDEEHFKENPGLLGQILAISFVDNVIRPMN